MKEWVAIILSAFTIVIILGGGLAYIVREDEKLHEVIEAERAVEAEVHGLREDMQVFKIEVSGRLGFIEGQLISISGVPFIPTSSTSNRLVQGTAPIAMPRPVPYPDSWETQ